MRRITSASHPYTLLQQRLQYAAGYPGRRWSILADNVPRWPASVPLIECPPADTVSEYAPCDGDADLRRAICFRESALHGRKIQDDHVLVTNGAMHGLSLVFRTLGVPGATAVCQAPAFCSVAASLASCGCHVRFFRAEDARVGLPESIRRETPFCLLYVNSPHNPTGIVHSEQMLREAAQAASEAGGALVVDAVYDSFNFTERPLYPAFTEEEWKCCYVVNSMSKNYGAPGLRIGWIMSSPENIRRLAGHLERECVAVAGTSQLYARSLLERGNGALVDTVKEGKDYLASRLAHIEGAECSDPAGGVQFLLKLPVEDVEAFADYLMCSEGLVLTTTSNYVGLKGAFVRIPMGYSQVVLEDALTMLASGLERFRTGAR